MGANADILSPLERDSDNSVWVKPKVDTINPRAAENLSKILKHHYEEGAEVALDLFHVRLLTNIGARMLCKTLYGRAITIENTNEAVQSSLEWAADYLYKRGELDDVPWQVAELL